MPNLFGIRTILPVLSSVIIAVLYLYLTHNKDDEIRYKKISYLNAFFCLLVLCSLAVSSIYAYRSYKDQTNVIGVRERIGSEKTIIHACGAIESSSGERLTYTNTLDALQNTIRQNDHFIEIDLEYSSDGRIICAHELEPPMSEAEFLNQKHNGEFTHMNLEMLTDVVRDNPDIFIITDIKGDNIKGCGQIASLYPELMDNFIIQVYHDREYDSIHKLGFKYIIYTLYATEEYERQFKTLQEAFSTHDYLGLTFWEDWVYQNPDAVYKPDGSLTDDPQAFYKNALSLGAPVYVHTVDDIDSIKRDIENGVSAVYTNNTENDRLRH